jgi:hypothetical protein
MSRSMVSEGRSCGMLVICITAFEAVIMPYSISIAIFHS